jgi:phenylalanyl-tRNA synthetase alpha chain
VEQDLNGLRDAFRADLAAAGDAAAVEAVRVRFLGQKSGRLTLLMKSLGRLPAAERPRAGELANRLRAEMEAALAERAATAGAPRRADRAPLDVSLPGAPPAVGSLHPVTLVRREIEAIFSTLGYAVEDGPEVETEFHNFEALNMPADHPARDAQDSFFAGPGRVLRTHTSPVQIRTMLSQRPPLKFIAPGPAYRRDAIDPNHTPVFFQVEGMAVGEGVSMADLKGTLEFFWKRLLGEAIAVRFRPSYFPFVEPGAEVDISCVLCLGRGCRSCAGSGWIEIMGAGMVHPALFEAVGYDPERFTGFAFGMGIDRITKLKFGIDDLRLFWENDVRFLSQFDVGGAP